MTIEEAIKHAEEVAESQEYEGKKLEESGEKYHDEYENYCASQCFECAEEHRQLAEWLKELKRLREQEPCEEQDIYEKAYKEGYDKGWNDGNFIGKNRWIPVSERLPEEYADVICCTDEEEIFIATYLGKMNDGVDYFDDDNGMMWESDVTAWMPLPQVYKLESEVK